jgi:transcription initiation factor IIE alpha subunit
MLDLAMSLASTMHILMEEVVKQIQKEHYSSFYKCLPICGLMFGFEFMLQVAL